MNKVLLVVIVLVLGLGGLYLLSNTNDGAATITGGESQPFTLEDGGMEDMDMDMDMDAETTSEVDAATSGMADMEIGDGPVFNVKGFNYGFDVEEIRVKEGDTVTINFESSEGFHDWVLDEFDAATAQVRPGTPTSVTFVADKAGTYEYYCAVGSHRAQGMVGTFIVE